MTPPALAERIVDDLDLTASMRVLEPSFGEGSFLLPLLRRLVALREGDAAERLRLVLRENVFGVELDPDLHAVALANIEAEFGPVPADHNLALGDFFQTEYFDGFFDCVVGNPPFGGTFDPAIEDRLDRRYGSWRGHKLKKETYSFFIARCLEWLAPAGTLNFISSDTFLTIKTMGGLRRRLMDEASVVLESLDVFSEETKQPTLVLHARRGGASEVVVVNGVELDRADIDLTGNFSWGLEPSLVKYFRGPSLGDYVVCSSGMTIGRNELFLRKISAGAIDEPYDFEFFDDPVTLEREIERARLHRVSPTAQKRISAREAAGETVRNVRAVQRAEPTRVDLPHSDYAPYNKANGGIVYSPPGWVIFWRDDGDAVLTFKKNGNWYLGGVGGQPFFGREGLTWGLISMRLNMRFLPAGYILDSGAPCAFLREGIDRSELWFILGWCLTDDASRILKTVINHTRNIQSKDVERLPYPFWLDASAKAEAVALVEAIVNEAQDGRAFDRDDVEIEKLNAIYAFNDS